MSNGICDKCNTKLKWKWSSTDNYDALIEGGMWCPNCKEYRNGDLKEWWESITKKKTK